MGLNFPWVSRRAFEVVERQLAASEAERSRLLGMLLAKQLPVASEQLPVKPTTDHRPPTTDPPNVVPFTTPFDRIEQKVSAALKLKQVPEQFRARMR